jgi:RHS repeat-associated protein
MSGGAARKIQETDYYAFGLDIQRNLVGVENKFQYNGKEKQDQEKMYDYGARFYDPVIGRWNVITSKIRTDDLDQEIRANNTPDHFITTDDMINGTNLGSLRALKAIAGKVTDDGNFILAACFVGNGQQGKDFSKALRKLTNGRLNIYMPKDLYSCT